MSRPSADTAHMDLDVVLARACELGASDIHLKLDQPPMIRRDGDIGPLPDAAALTDDDLEDAVAAVTARSPARFASFEATGELDLSYPPLSLPRFRVNMFRQRGAISIALRVIPRKVPTFD